jgi:hypothetical protein
VVFFSVVSIFFFFAFLVLPWVFTAHQADPCSLPSHSLSLSHPFACALLRCFFIPSAGVVIPFLWTLPLTRLPQSPPSQNEKQATKLNSSKSLFFFFVF